MRKFLDQQIQDTKDEHDDFIATLKECCRDPRVIVELFRTTDPQFNWSEDHFKMVSGILGWQSDMWPNLVATRDEEGNPLVYDHDTEAGLISSVPNRMAPAPSEDESSSTFQVCNLSLLYSFLFILY